MKLLPILDNVEDNLAIPLFKAHAEEYLQMTVDYFQKIGYKPPWIGYFVELNGELVGNAAFKGLSNDKVAEIAYGTFEAHRRKGIGTEICRQLVLLAQQTDPSVRITARTLPEQNYSTRILEKNGFVLLGTVQDPDDGAVWEWEYLPKS
ncbi:MAG: GNAT family N-acetyltransferase [Bacteroidetes bacterium]|nr:GNAT family N-acetyltransferase [Bacteroidota bacterium]